MSIGNYIINILIYKLRWLYYKQKLKYLGKNVRIEKGVLILNPQKVSIGDHSWIDRYTILEGGNGIEIGRYVHVATFCHLQGGGILKIGDYAGISSGCKIYSDTNYHPKRMSAALPIEQQEIKSAPVIIEKDVFIGINSVILPGAKIGEGAVIGASSLVNKDIPPWVIAVGSPAKIIGTRTKVNLPDI